MSHALRRVVAALVLAVALVLVVQTASSSGAGGFRQCGNIPSKGLYGIRGDGVDCGKSKHVAKKYRSRAINNGSSSQRFGTWECKGKSYGDGVNVKCKKRGPSNDEVRFAFGG